jgi:predicted PurR-regulated permease PerM
MQKNTPYILFLTFVLLVTVSFFLLIKDFLLACFGAIILAVVFDPVYQRFRQYFKNSEKLALFLTMMMIILVFVIPLLILTLMITEESTNYYLKIQGGEINPQVYFQETLKLLLPKFNKLSHMQALSIEQISASSGNAFAEAVKYIAQQVPALTQNLLNLIVQFALTFYILFFLLRDGQQLIRKLISLIPIGDGIETELFERFTSVARATVKGGLIVAVIQGSIGGFFLVCRHSCRFFMGYVNDSFIFITFGQHASLGPRYGNSVFTRSNVKCGSRFDSRVFSHWYD